ncbi:MAG: DUF5329 family protein [Thermodesulfobacteriota bacterium]
MKKIMLWLALFLAFTGGYACAQNVSAAVEIRHLIESVEALQGAAFIRNGSEYDAGKAAEHLRIKLKMAGDRVKSAEDFIELCASKSSLSGEAYRIRLSDGTVIDAEAFFRRRLKALRTDTPS